MPLGTPDVLDSFILGGVKLTSAAPEQFKEAVKSWRRYFFFRNGDPIVQQGRVIPRPITLDFKMNGPDALDNMRFFKRMAMQSQEIPFTWAGAFNFTGYLDEFEATYAQKVVTGTLTYQPIKDLANKDATPGALVQTPVQRTAALTDAMGQVTNAVGTQAVTGFLGLGDMLSNIEGVISTDLSSVYGFISSAQDVVSQINDAISTYYDITSIPYEIVSSFADLANSAIALIPSAVDALNNNILDPGTPILQGTDDYLAIGWGETGLSLLDDSSVGLSLIVQTLAPQPLTYVVAEGDTIQGICDLWGVLVATFLSVNPGINDTTLTVGITVVIPNG